MSIIFKVHCTLQLISKQLCILNSSSAYKYFNAIITAVFLKYQYFNTVSIFMCFYSHFVSLSTLIKTTVFLFSQTKKKYTKLYQHDINAILAYELPPNISRYFVGWALSPLLTHKNSLPPCWISNKLQEPTFYQLMKGICS